MSPLVSVLIANYNGGAYLTDCLLTATQQSLCDIEIILVDDASTDGSAGIAREFARRDPRVRVIELQANSGPSLARNAGLAVAKGRWVAILDGDDMMHPNRLRALVAEAERSGAEICADDLLIFQDGRPPTSLLPDPQNTPRWLTPREFVLSNQIFGQRAPLGYLKPLIDMAFLRKHGLSYRPSLRIGEDYDLALRLMARGARYRLIGDLGYFYRKHASSVSVRIAAGEVEEMLRADREALPSFDATDGPLMQAWAARRRSLERALAFSHLVTAIKSRDWAGAARLAIAEPGALPLLIMPVAMRLKRFVRRAGKPEGFTAEKRACLIVRQRVVSSMSGSSAYLLSLCQALGSQGYRITAIFPNPATFGRWPFLRFGRETAGFDEIFVRGSLQIGRRLFLARSFKVWLTAALTVAEKLGRRVGLVGRSRIKPAPYAVAVPWSRDDQLFIAQHAPRGSRLVVADYAFVTPGIAYALEPKAHSLVVMHDLFSSRAGRFEALNAADSVAAIDEAAELELLRGADAVVAIQANEARFVAERLGGRCVILAPMAATPVEAPQPGDDRTLLFVGSNTAPNVLGLKWFVDEAWPDLRAVLPDCRLLVAGSVANAFTAAPEGVTFLGLVPDLAPLYRDAGVVISPLQAGSGLKIKLIEALSRGKATVATSATLEGIEAVAGPAVSVADAAGDFARSIMRLLRDRGLRERKCREALEVARAHFSPEACYAELLGYVEQPLKGAAAQPSLPPPDPRLARGKV